MKWKKFISYYRPYVKAFLADMFLPAWEPSSHLVIPLIIRYITNTVIYFENRAGYEPHPGTCWWFYYTMRRNMRGVETGYAP